MAVSNAKANVASTNVWSPGAQNALIFLSAALSNMYASAVSNPLDIIKVRQQLKMQTTGGATNSFWAIGAEMARTEGVLSLMNGLTASMLREFSYSGIRMGTYDFFKDTFSSMSGGRLQNDGLALKLLSATIASTLGSAIANPTDLVKVRMQAYSPTGRPYATTRAAFASVWREGGLRALYRGADAITARGVVLTVSQICSYDQTKQIFKRRGLMEEGLPLHATVSMIAGFVCSVASNPVDVVKVRVMNDKERRYRGVVDCVRQIMTNEGPRAFFKGFPMCWARLGAHTVLTFVAFERLRMWFGIRPM